MFEFLMHKNVHSFYINIVFLYEILFAHSKIVIQITNNLQTDLTAAD